MMSKVRGLSLCNLSTSLMISWNALEHLDHLLSLLEHLRKLL
jgi:hypothetical protein